MRATTASAAGLRKVPVEERTALGAGIPVTESTTLDTSIVGAARAFRCVHSASVRKDLYRVARGAQVDRRMASPRHSSCGKNERVA
jgi:hypothetical protein